MGLFFLLVWSEKNEIKKYLEKKENLRKNDNLFCLTEENSFFRERKFYCDQSKEKRKTNKKRKEKIYKLKFNNKNLIELENLIGIKK